MKSFDKILENMKAHSLKVPREAESLKLNNSKTVLKNAMNYFLGLENVTAQWLPEYDKIADWLTDNKGRGLFMFGNCGRGKSKLGRYVIPAIYLKYFGKVVSSYDIQEMNKHLDEVLSKSFISLDDIGTEELVNRYGNKRMAFPEIMDAVEKNRKIIIISSNLGEQELREIYGDRIFDRIKATTTRVVFSGKSLRQ